MPELEPEPDPEVVVGVETEVGVLDLEDDVVALLDKGPLLLDPPLGESSSLWKHVDVRESHAKPGLQHPVPHLESAAVHEVSHFRFGRHCTPAGQQYPAPLPVQGE